MKKIIIFIFIIFSSFLLVSCIKQDTNTNDNIDNKEEEPIKNLLIADDTITYYATDLLAITDTNVNLRLENDNLVLIDKDKPAEYQSKPIEFNQFLELVMTWNASINDGGSATFRIILSNDDTYSQDFIMGYFQKNSYRSISNQTDDFGRVNIDTLINKDINNNKVIIKINVNGSIDNEIKINNISVTTKNSETKAELDYSNLIEKLLLVPPKQQLSIPRIGNLICSPTSLSMVIDYYGFKTNVTDVSSHVADKGYNGIYGNWTINTSYASTYEGLHARVEYINDFNDVITYIKNDIPVVMSIKTTSKEQLTGSIMAYSQGHLLVLIGFEQIGTKWYAIVNDPAEYEDEKVLRKYEIEQLFEVWRNYTYIISNDKL